MEVSVVEGLDEGRDELERCDPEEENVGVVGVSGEDVGGCENGDVDEEVLGSETSHGVF